MAIPFVAALGNASDQRVGSGKRRTNSIAADDRALERLQRRDFADADVAIAVATGAWIGGPHFGNDHQHYQQQRDDRDARGDREIQQGDGASLTHATAVAGC